tara:strand:+ start:66 stop:1043 length:978 start_codon:yes stop_codon:yes gene_type:complete
MAKPTTRETLQDYCLRALGHPVIEINIDEDQMSDRIDEAIQYYQEYHGDAIVRNLLKHKVTNSSLVVNSTGNTAIAVGETIEDATTGAKAVVKTISGDVATRAITYDNVTTPGLKFTAGNNITINSETHPIVGTPIQGNIELGYIDSMPLNFLSINNVFNINTATNAGMFSIDYQLHLNDIYDLNGPHGGLVNYEMTKQYMSLIDRNINGNFEMIEWSRHKNRVNFHSTTLSDVGVDNYVVFDGYTTIDPDSFSDVYNDMFLKKYTTALFKRQWGNNLIKFEGMQLPGGVTINGEQILSAANEEIRELEEQMQLKHEMPPLDFIG